MANKTIYVKDEALWERVKQVAGKEGLSALIATALQEFLERREQDKRGFAPQKVYVEGDAFPDGQLVRFNGRQLVERTLANLDGEPVTSYQVFQTQGGKLVLLLTDVGIPEHPFEYRTYDSLDELGKDTDAFGGIMPDAREEFLESVAAALGEKWAVWID